MIDASPLLLFGLWALFGGGSSAPTRRPWPETAPTAPVPSGGGIAPPWPQASTATGLPPFPGSGWEYDEPPPAAVKQRAAALVSTLWATGIGSHRIEQTGGRWIAYRAEKVASGRNGVVAYRVKRAGALPPPAAPRAPAPALPRPAAQAAPAAPVLRPQAAPRPPVTSSPAAPPPAAAPAGQTPVVVLNPSTLPVLRFGMGLKPAAPVPEVRLAQQRLGVEADGRFGAITRTAVIEFQRRTGLAPNEPNEKLQARGFGVIKEATWTKLLATR